MVDFEITKKQKLLEVNNDMCHNYYYLIHGRIYNDGKTKYKKFKYVLWFDIFDVQEYFEKDIISKEDVKQYMNEIESNYLTMIENYEDTKKINEFYKYCNETIEDYNRINGGR